MPDYGGGISALIDGVATSTTISFMNVTATSNTAGRSRTGIDCVGCVVASLATGHSSMHMHIGVFIDVGNVICQAMVVGYPR